MATTFIQFLRHSQLIVLKRCRLWLSAGFMICLLFIYFQRLIILAITSYPWPRWYMFRLHQFTRVVRSKKKINSLTFRASKKGHCKRRWEKRWDDVAFERRRVRWRCQRFTSWYVVQTNSEHFLLNVQYLENCFVKSKKYYLYKSIYLYFNKL